MKNHYKSLINAERDAEKENCRIATGSNGYTDIYYLVPMDAEKGKIYRTITRSQRDAGPYMNRVIYITLNGDIKVIEASSDYRVSIVRQGLVSDDKVVDYLNGYYTRAEERSKKIRDRKERARISHRICCETGKEGHDLRQAIRRELAQKG